MGDSDLHEVLQTAASFLTAVATCVLAVAAVWPRRASASTGPPIRNRLSRRYRPKLATFASMVLLLDESADQVNRLVDEVLDDWVLTGHLHVVTSMRLKARLIECLWEQMGDDYRDAIDRGVAMDGPPRVNLWELGLDDAHMMIARRLPPSARWRFARSYWDCWKEISPPRRWSLDRPESPAPGRSWATEDS